jgi:hypothetical protein
VRPFLGERLTMLFAHAVSTFFRRILLESGERPDALVLDEREQAVADFGRQLARDANGRRDRPRRRRLAGSNNPSA